MIARLSKFVLPAAVFCFLVVMGLLIWGVARGFDIEDEGYYLVALRHPELYPSLQASFHNLAARLLGTEAGVVTYRWTVLWLRLGSALLLSIGLWHWVRQEIEAEADLPLLSQDEPAPPAAH